MNADILFTIIISIIYSFFHSTSSNSLEVNFNNLMMDFDGQLEKNF